MVKVTIVVDMIAHAATSVRLPNLGFRKLAVECGTYTLFFGSIVSCFRVLIVFNTLGLDRAAIVSYTRYVLTKYTTAGLEYSSDVG